MKKQPLVSIIIINWNGLSDTLVCLASLRKTTYPNFEAIVLDNGSKKNEAVVIHKNFGEFAKVSRSKKNKGFTGGNNWAIKKVKGKYVVLLNNDTTVKPGWLTHLVDVMEADKQIMVAQPKILLMKEKTRFDYAGAAGGFVDRYGYPFTQGRIFETLEEDRGQYDHIRDIFWTSGAAMIFRTNLISKVRGLFDDNFFNYMEEIDFCWRVWNKGFRVVVIPKSVVYHRVAGSARRVLFKKRFWEHRNNLLLLAKNLPKDQIVKVFTGRVLFELFTYLYYLGTLNVRYVASLLVAHLDFLRLLPSTLSNRQEAAFIQYLPVYPRSIVVDYFIKGKRYFWELDWDGARGERTVQGLGYLSPTFSQHQKVYQFCQKYAKNKEVLDMGCGSGTGTFLLSKAAKSIVGIDSDAQSVSKATAKSEGRNLSFRTVDILDFDANPSFDVVVSLQVIEHMKERQAYLSKVIKSLKPGGVAVLSTPNRITQSYNENPYHFREYSAQELKKLLEKHFKKVKIYGLYGDKKVKAYENERRGQVLRIMNLDKLRLRRLFGRKLRVFLFETLIPIVRSRVAKKMTRDTFSISEANFSVKESTKGAIDLIAVCKK